MVRFCDKEVFCVEFDKIRRQDLLHYFLDGNIGDAVCVVDADGKYLGMITYHSLLNNMDISEAISRKYVTLDDNIWQNIRHIFIESNTNGYNLIPVVDKEGQLISFAYEDVEANREIRMLRELMEMPEALAFPDIYPEYQCVRIYEFNELAFFFAEYLKSHGIPVQVYGILWKYMGEKFESRDFLEYQYMSIYAEGIVQKSADWINNLLRTVSVEFECVDKIYEENLRRGIIKNVKGNCADLLERLKSAREIVILGTGIESQDAYDFLTGNGIDVCCFASNVKGKDIHKIFGKTVLSEIDVMNNYETPIFIDCISQNSAWGGGEIEYYDYLGYERNRQYIFLKDYVEIEGNCLIKSVSASKAFLVGDIYLCKYLYDYFEKNMIVLEGYLDMEGQNDEMHDLPRISIDHIDSDMMCLIVIPEYFTPRNMQAKVIRRVITYLKENRIDNYSDYFSFATPFMHIESMNNLKYTKMELRPKRIVLGSIESCCGNVFFRSLLDGHPSIMMTNFTLGNDTLLNDNLFLLCVRLSTEKPGNIVNTFWKIYKAEGRDEICDQPKFSEKMGELLSCGNAFTPQELFIAFHIAYMRMLGSDIPITDISDMVIYWEPHFMERKLVEEYVTCLNSEEVSCNIVNVVRNICMRNGAVAKGYISMGWLGDKAIAYDAVLSYPSIDKKDYGINSRLVIRFEDLKCKPTETLLEMCRRWGIAWSDSLMMTTNNGKSSAYDNGERAIKDFDLEPVYNIYEKYFSEFDRLRLMIINAPWQWKYGYPYEKISRFSRRELQEMYLQEFRFEKMIAYSGTEPEFVLEYRKQIMVRNRLLKIRYLELFAERPDQTDTV